MRNVFAERRFAERPFEGLDRAAKDLSHLLMHFLDLPWDPLKPDVRVVLKHNANPVPAVAKSSWKTYEPVPRLQDTGENTQTKLARKLSKGEDDIPAPRAPVTASADSIGLLTFELGDRNQLRLTRSGFEPLSFTQGSNYHRPNVKPQLAVVESTVDLVAKELAKSPEEGIMCFINTTHNLLKELPFHNTYSWNMQLNASDVRQMAGEGVDLSGNLLLNLRTSPLIRGGKFTRTSPWEMQVTFPDVHMIHKPDWSARASEGARVKTKCTAILQDPRHEISSGNLGQALIKETMTSLRDIAMTALGPSCFAITFPKSQQFAESLAATLASDTSWLPSGLQPREVEVSVGRGKETDILGHASAQTAQNGREMGQPPSEIVDNTTPANDSVYVALGSNVGDRLEAIEAACRAIDEDQDMRILSTSALYETEPMYVENQERFLNGVCEVSFEQSVCVFA
ncbi:hypothetical protein KC336_g20000 [Hortaea werneckii]|nr:hypothetical protein KC336_g20000 [Hortaea werneckii]